MRSLTMVCCTALLGACATAPPVSISPAPICSSQAECDMKWVAARSFVLANCGYKFQTYSSDFMETYNPTGGDTHLGAQVNREPAGDGTYRIVAKFWCDNPFGCFPPAAKTLNDFTAAINAVRPTSR